MLLNPYISFPAAGGGGLPASVTRFWAPSDMTFNGSNELTAITDRVHPGSPAYINVVGAPTGDTTDGINYTKATALANHISFGSDVWWANPGRKMSFLFRPSGSGFAASTLLIDNASSSVVILARDAQATAAAQNIAVGDFRVNGSLVSGLSTQDELWDNAFALSGWVVLTILGVTRTAANSGTVLRLFSYSAGSNFQFDGDVAGFSEFTDDADAGAVEAALLAEVA